MAGPYYVESTTGNDADDGLSKANAKATVGGALAVAAAGERVLVSKVHAESVATALALVSAGTFVAPVEVFCIDFADDSLSTGATITTTGASDLDLGDGTGVTHWKGLTFNCGTSGNPNLGFQEIFTLAIECVFVMASGGAGSSISLSGGDVLLIDCSLVFSHVSQGMGAFGFTDMRGGSIALTGVVPTRLLIASVWSRFRGVNLSQFGAGKSLVDVSASGLAVIRFEQCSVGAGVAFTAGVNSGSTIALFDNCDSADTQYRMQHNSIRGDVYSETTIVHVRPRPSGAQPLSHKMVSSAHANFLRPLYGPEIVRRLPTVGSPKTIWVEIIHDSVTPLTDGDVYLEVEYLGTNGVPLALFTSDRKADILATAANQTLSVVDWVTTGITNVMKQKLEVTVTPQMAGWVRGRVALAKASASIYVDPRLVVS